MSHNKNKSVNSQMNRQAILCRKLSKGKQLEVLVLENEQKEELKAKLRADDKKRLALVNK